MLSFHVVTLRSAKQNIPFLPFIQMLQEKIPSDLYNWQLQPLLWGRLRRAHILSNTTQKCPLNYLMAEACVSLLLCDLIQRRDSCGIFNGYIKIAGCTRNCLTSMKSLKSSDQSAECLWLQLNVQILKPYHFSFWQTAIFSYCKINFINHLAKMWLNLKFFLFYHGA